MGIHREIHEHRVQWVPCLKENVGYDLQFSDDLQVEAAFSSVATKEGNQWDNFWGN